MTRVIWGRLAGVLIPILAVLARDGAHPAVLADGPGVLRDSYYAVYLPVTAPPVPVVSAAQFAPERGFYETPIAVTLTTDTPGAVVRYTTDGRAPTTDQGTVYSGPVRVATTTVLRAAAFLEGYETSEVTTHSYLFLNDVVRQPAKPTGFPSTWGVFPAGSAAGLAGEPIPADYEMDPRVVNDPRYRDEIADDLSALPTMSVVTAPGDMFGASRGIYASPTVEGAAWERPASVELIHPDGRPGFQVNCGIRVAGAWSRLPDGTPKHSFSLHFKSVYGPTKLRYQVFPDVPVSRFDNLRLRGGQADSFPFFPLKAQYVHDEWGRRTQADMGWVSAYGIFVHLYLNGLYWGLYNVVEEPTASFAAEHFGGDKDHYDVIKDYHQVEDGDLDAYAALIKMPRMTDLTMRERYERVAQLLDLRQHADYTLVQIYGANRDWPHKNWRAVRHRLLDQGFQFFVWDMEHVAQLWGFDAQGYNADTPGVDGLHGWLKQFPEYRLLFADRVRRHFFDGGALTPTAARDRYQALADVIDGPIVAESARWGDGGPGERTRNENFSIWSHYWKLYGRDYPQNRDDHWRPERDRLLTEFFPVRTRIVLAQLCREGLYPPVAAPAFSQYGGPIRPGFWLAMSPGGAGCAGSRRDGVVYYTTDGSDPRQPWTASGGQPWSGLVSPRARPYTMPVHLAGFTAVKARVLAGGTWSALTEAVFGTPRIAITEIMYNPHGGSDYEFIEFQNREDVAVDLSGMRTEGITTTLPSGARLGPGEHFLLVRDAVAFRDRYPGVVIDGLYEGKLANEGETLRLRDATGDEVVSVTYDDEGFWPLAPDGGGHSLVVVNPVGNPDDPENWRASTFIRGSPGEADPPPPYGRVVVNEVLAHGPAPLEDAVEVYNTTAGPVDIGGWFLSDDRTEPRKYRIPVGKVIPPGGYAVVFAESFGADPETGFGLSGKGETVVLASATADGHLTGYLAGATFGLSEEGVSWGRHRTSAGVEFVPLSARTFGVDDPQTVEDFRQGEGAPNAGPRFGPVVVNELMYQPADGRAEFIELYNLSARPVALFDQGFPENTWRFVDGIRYEFPPGVVIPDGGYLLVAGIDPDTFRRQYGLNDGIAVLGPFDGKLNNGGERVALAKPGAPGDGELPYYAVDWLDYDDREPWPTHAAGGGAALERISPSGYGNEPRNWSALTDGGTPGRANTMPVMVYLPGLPNG